MENRAHDTSSEVTAEEDEVMIDGPGGVALSLTPEAALETSDRLLHGGLTGTGQQIGGQRRTKRRDAPDAHHD